MQLPELPKAPVVGDALKLTVPGGALAPLNAVSVTVAVQVLALPVVTEFGEQATLVDVASTGVLLPTPNTSSTSSLPWSAMYTFPELSAATPSGLLRSLLVAGPGVGAPDWPTRPAMIDSVPADRREAPQAHSRTGHPGQEQ